MISMWLYNGEPANLRSQQARSSRTHRDVLGTRSVLLFLNCS
jgi:hypothetical protein